MSKANSKSELFEAFETLSCAIPSMRAGQLVAAVGELCADLHGRGLWDAEDKELLEAIWQFQRNFESSAIGVAQESSNQSLEQTAATTVPAN
jgi:hypothetical protein